jgi:hypothetical protein
LLPWGAQLSSFKDVYQSLHSRIRNLTEAFCNKTGGTARETTARETIDVHHVRAVSSDLVRAPTEKRVSRETGEQHELGGYLGSVVYEGPTLGACMPWLRIAEMICLGKYISFGNGKISVEVLA